MNNIVYMNKTHPYGLPFCKERFRCARFGSDYCTRCIRVTQDNRDNNYYFKESGD